MNTNNQSQIFSDQVIADLVRDGIAQKEAEKLASLLEIQEVANEKMQYAYDALRQSLQCVENVRDFASDSNLNHVLGAMSTKHGEIAEHIQVEIQNGRDILQGIQPTSTFDGVGRTAPEDYIISGDLIQSKFINGANKSLDAVLSHLKDYPGFADKGYYHIPKDQFELIQKITQNGYKTEGVNVRTIQKCQELIKEIEIETGKPFAEVVKPGISSYGEVQLNKVSDTLDKYEGEFTETNKSQIDKIKKEQEEQTEAAQHITDASWGEALKYSAVSAVIQGTTSAGIKIFLKVHNGKKLKEFTKEDWIDVGYDFGGGAIKGSISGLGIYGLTKVAGFSAPFAGAMVSTTMGLASLLVEYKSGKISKIEFGESANALSVEAGLIAIGSAIGQAVIPIPALGAIVGYAVTKSSLEITKKLVGKDEQDLIKYLEDEYRNAITKLDAETKEIIDSINSYFSKLGGYIDAALSVEVAARLYGSVELCKYLAVPYEVVIHNSREMDIYMGN